MGSRNLISDSGFYDCTEFTDITGLLKFCTCVESIKFGRRSKLPQSDAWTLESRDAGDESLEKRTVSLVFGDV